MQVPVPVRFVHYFTVVLFVAAIASSAPAQSVTRPIAPAPPRVYLDTTYTPPSGRTISLRAGADLQAALNSAQPGDTITLEAGAVFRGNFTLPKKQGSDWIVIRSAA